MKTKAINPKLNLRYNRIETPSDNYYIGCSSPKPVKVVRNSKKYSGRIKCRLIHSPHRSVVLPDFLFFKNGWIQPLQFTPNMVNVSNGQIELSIDIPGDVALRVRINTKDPLQKYPDRSHLYSCIVDGPKEIYKYYSGDYIEQDDHIYLGLYHHTDEAGKRGIQSSGYIRSGNWNIKGKKTSRNTSFVYLTHLSKASKRGDLKAIAMTDDEHLPYQIDEHHPAMALFPGYVEQQDKYIYKADVYERKLESIKESIKIYIPISFIDVKHTFFHTKHGPSAYYEIFAPLIQRVRVVPETNLLFNNNGQALLTNEVVSSDYLIEGDASIVEGLAAPFDEDHALGYAVIQDCGEETISEFWESHANQDLFTSAAITPSIFEQHNS